MRRELPTYEHTDKQTLYKASKHSFQNAKRYSEDAKILFENGSYGHSIALSALGMEELAKSLEFFNIGLTKTVAEKVSLTHLDDIKEFMDKRLEMALKNHTLKQKEAHKATMSIQMQIKMIIDLLNSPLRDKFSESEKDALIKIETYMKNAEENARKNSELIEHLDQYKLHGMYVDIQASTSGITGPHEIKKEDADGYLKMLSDYIAIWEFFQFNKTINEFWGILTDLQNPLNEKLNQLRKENKDKHTNQQGEAQDV